MELRKINLSKGQLYNLIQADKYYISQPGQMEISRCEENIKVHLSYDDVTNHKRRKKKRKYSQKVAFENLRVIDKFFFFLGQFHYLFEQSKKL